jgi:UDP-glucose 4-epimerase
MGVPAVRVLVTGSAGFIGGAVRAELQSRGDDPLPFDGSADVCDRAHLDCMPDDVGAVINLAGVLGTGELFGGERHAAEVNVLGALNVLDFAAERGVALVQIGTGHKGQPNPYAITKACAEDLALARARWRGDRVTVVRAYHVYGPGQKPPPPHGASPVRKIVPSFVCRALSRMPLEVYGSGQQQIDLVHVAEVARVLVDAVGGPYGEVVEAGTGKPTSVLDAACDVLDHIDPDGATAVSVAHLPMRPGEPPDAMVVADFGACSNPWPYRLDETVRWYRDWLASR